MGIKKNQHFVPQFYLRHFSKPPNYKSIGVWNIDGNKFASNAAIKKQACKKYFYDNNGVFEDSLSRIEWGSSLVLTEIINTHKLPESNQDAHLILLIFLVNQAERTSYAADMVNESIDKLLRVTFRQDKSTNAYLSNSKIELERPTTYLLNIASKLFPIIADLGIKILKNNTEIKFITSDNPVVKYNQFMALKKWPGGHTGWAAIGLQVFYPIHPNLCLVFFDKNIYRFGHRQRKLIEINNINDIEQINKLQYLNAYRNIYFNPTVKEPYIKNLHDSNIQNRKAHKVLVREYYEISPQRSKTIKSLVSIHQRNIVANLSLTFCSLLKKAKKFELGPSMANYRNPELLRIVESTLGKRIY
jgi:hypothetical protein